MTRKIKVLSVLFVALFAISLLTLAQDTPPAKFDGHQLYQAAFKDFVDYSIVLRDPAVRAKWTAEWEHKHDKDGVLDTEDGADQAVFDMMHSLGNRFDYFFLPEDTQREQEQMDPAVIGIGVSINIKGGDDVVKTMLATLPANPTLRQRQDLGRKISQALKALTVGPNNPLQVLDVNPDGMAIKAGLLKNDHIIAINGQPIAGLRVGEVSGQLRGKEGVSVTVTIERVDSTGKYAAQPAVTIVRKRFVTHVVHSKDLGSGITYISLSDFESKYSVDEMRDALTKAAKGRAVILDLRGNPGGLIPNGEAIAEMFLNNGTIEEVIKRDGDNLSTRRMQLEPEYAQDANFSSDKPQEVHVGQPEDREDEVLPDDMPVIVLVDENSYSCSEILSGALQANHRATIVGEPTGGKGVGQSVIDLPFGHRLHVTSLEFRPGGKAMDWVGIIPEVLVEQPKVDPKTLTAGAEPPDAQLNAATKLGIDLIAKQDALRKLQQDQRKKHEDDFKKDQQ